METSTTFRASTPKERRRERRVTPDPFLVIRLSSGNTGIVLDVSHGGLGFLASAPVEEAQAIHFVISGRLTVSSGAAGQIMWKDGTRKRAGLKFTTLPDELRALIATCFPTPEIQRAVTGKQTAASSRHLIGDEPSPPMTPSRRTRLTFVVNAVTWAVAALIALGIWYPVAGPRAVISLLQSKQQVMKFISYRRALHARASLAQPAKKADVASAERPKPFIPFAHEGLPFPPRSSKHRRQFQLEAIASSDAPKLARPATDLVATKLASAENRAALLLRGDQGETSLTLARELLQKDAASETQAKGAQLLWQAVAKGNVQAELELANLYLTGQGVGKSCSQARVLLTAAQNRKSELAAQKLGELSQYGCD